MEQDYIINEYILKLSGKANLPQALILGNSYKVLIDGEITTSTDSNNQDGTKDRIYKFEPILCEIIKDNGETIKARDIRKRSVQLRNTIYKDWQSKNISQDFEDYYDIQMVGIIKRFIDEYQ